jgi:hypothetical protein
MNQLRRELLKQRMQTQQRNQATAQAQRLGDIEDVDRSSRRLQLQSHGSVATKSNDMHAPALMQNRAAQPSMQQHGASAAFEVVDDETDRGAIGHGRRL